MSHTQEDMIQLLKDVRDHFLFDDDDGQMVVSDAIDSDLFDRICKAINGE